MPNTSAASVPSDRKRTAADIDSRFQLFRWWRRTGVFPLGAQVDLTERRRLNPLSSWKTIQASLALVFFYLGPAFIDPTFDGRVVPFHCPPRRTLATPAHLTEHPPDVPRVILHP